MANNNKRHSFEWSRAWRRNGRGKQKVNCPSNEVRSIFLKNKSFKCFVVSVLKKNIKNWLYRVSQPQSRFCQVKNPSNVCESNLFVCTKNFFMTHLCKVINLIRIKCLPSLALGNLQGREEKILLNLLELLNNLWHIQKIIKKIYNINEK